MFIICRLRDITCLSLYIVCFIFFYKLTVFLENNETFTSDMHYILVFVNTKHSLCKALDTVYVLTCTTFSFFSLCSPSCHQEAVHKPVLIVIERGW